MIKDILTDELVVTDVKAIDWEDAIKICGNLLASHNKIDNTYIESMIKAVDDYGPYMIMIPEIALFHGRPNEGVKEVCLSLATFSDPVQFNDEKSIKAAFTFGAVDSNSHVDILGKMATLLQNEDFVMLLRNNGSKKEIMNIIKNN